MPASTARDTSSNASSTDFGQLVLEQVVERRLVVRLQRLERQLVLRAGTSPPAESSSVTVARGIISGSGTPKCA